MIERREGEGMTEFTIRRVRVEIIEQCAKVCDELRRADYSGENEDWIAGTTDCAKALRALAAVSSPPGSDK